MIFFEGEGGIPPSLSFVGSAKAHCRMELLGVMVQGAQRRRAGVAHIPSVEAKKIWEKEKKEKNSYYCFM